MISGGIGDAREPTLEGEEPDGDPGAGTFSFTVDAARAGMRLDAGTAAAAQAAGLVLSRTRVRTLAEAGQLSLDDKVVSDIGRKLRTGERIALDVPPAEEAAPVGEPIPLTIPYEDAHLVVVDKPAGLVVHPAPGHPSGTLVNALIAHCGDSLSGIGGVRRPGIVHRLDRDTSGLLVVAKTDAAHQGLARLFADHGRTLPLTRTYVAFVWNKPDRPAGTVETSLGRHATDRLRMAVVPEAKGRPAITHWRLDATFGQGLISRLSCDLETGRTHQIRVHMAHLGHPVVGDPLYGKGFRTKSAKLEPSARAVVDALERQALHAATLGFAHPVTGEHLLFESALPPDLLALEAVLRA